MMDAYILSKKGAQQSAGTVATAKHKRRKRLQWLGWAILAAGFATLYLQPLMLSTPAAHQWGGWLISSACLTVLVVLLCLRAVPGRFPMLASVVAASTSMGNLLLGVSIYVQGSGFNDRFFHHFDLATLNLVRIAYPLEAALAGLWLVAITLLPQSIATRCPKQRPIRLGRCWQLSICVAGLLTHAPLASLLKYGQERYQRASAQVIESAETVLVTSGELTWEGGTGRQFPNLVLVVAEGLEASYANPELVGRDLTPKLSLLERQALRFTDLRQVPAASWTMGGLVASQCALPIEIPGDWIEEMVRTGFADNPMNRVTASGEMTASHDDINCLGDILSSLGFHTVFMGGAPLAFAGKGKFLARQGFRELQGFEHFLSIIDEPSDFGRWGLRDDRLFDLAATRIASLEQAGEPYALVLLTLDTHDPMGRDISSSCGPQPLFLYEAMRASVQCADRLIANFLHKVMKSWPQTVVALMSDHLALPNGIFPQPAQSGDRRRLRFAVWGSSDAPRTVGNPGTHFDITPTLLDIMGVAGYDRHHAGVSLLRHDSFWLTHPDPENARFALIHSLLGLCVDSSQTIAFEADGPVIGIADRRVLATTKGYGLHQSVFTLRFDDHGCLDEVPPALEAEAYMGREKGNLVIGVSTNADLNRRLGHAHAEIVYFHGKVGEANFETGPIRTEITRAELRNWGNAPTHRKLAPE